MEVNYSVTIEEFAERHYIKSFHKKYKTAWDVTLRSIVAEFERVDVLLSGTDRAELITELEHIKILKTSFRVAKTKESAKTSGNRCIVLVDEKKRAVSVLLVYTKTDLPSTNETAEWKKLVLNNYPETKKYLSVN
jgi:hypothetical protein